MADENFDSELESMREYLEKQFSEALEKAVADLEKRSLLNLLANNLDHCRLCPNQANNPAGKLDPAPTELEKLWHDGNHGRFQREDRSRGVPPQPSAFDWDAWEEAVKARRK